MKERIDHLLEELLANFSEGSLVDEACLHAVRGGGRIRPQITCAVANTLNNSCPIEPVALSVELLHCSSLIADDLPCMDNDSERRGLPTCHIAFGQEIAILASYKLISIAYYCLSQFQALIPLERHLLGLQIVSQRTAQMIDGQLSDLRFEKDKSAPKTTALFQASFSLGWIYGGGALNQLKSVERAAYLFGSAFQMADDLHDGEVMGEVMGAGAFSRAFFEAKEELKKIGLLSIEMADLLARLETSYSAAGSS